jgi:Fe-S cluster biosynthesis and repair protein YggX
MGRDLLAEDYLLKQITSSLIYPEDGLGKKFWDKVYERAWNEYHTTMSR